MTRMSAEFSRPSTLTLVLSAILFSASLVTSADLNQAGYDRLVGKYEGTMYFTDDGDSKKQKEMRIELEILGQPGGLNWAYTYHFDPPKFSRSVDTTKVQAAQTEWADGQVFELKGWDRFCKSQSDSFTIRTDRHNSLGGKNGVLTRTYTRTKIALISEKWLQFPGGRKYRSHKMILLAKS